MNKENNRKLKHENALVNILLNVVIPVLILTQLSSEDRLGPVISLVVALIFPISYGLFDIYKRKKINFFSILGTIGVLLTGGIGLLQLDNKWIAIKEALVPLVIALAILFTQKTKFSVLRLFLNEIIDLNKVDNTFTEKGHSELFEKQMANVGYIIGFAFLVSSILNYILAKWIVVSEPGSSEFTAELGRMTVFTYPVIVVPTFIILAVALTYLIKSIEKNTDLEIEDVIRK